MSKISVGEFFTVALNSGSENFLWTRGGKGVSKFSIENILSHSAENLRWESFTVALFSGTGKVWIEGGSIKILRQKYFLSHSAENFRSGIFYYCINFGYRKSVEQRGGIKILCRKIFISQCRNFP